MQGLTSPPSRSQVILFSTDPGYHHAFEKLYERESDTGAIAQGLFLSESVAEIAAMQPGRWAGLVVDLGTLNLHTDALRAFSNANLGAKLLVIVDDHLQALPIEGAISIVFQEEIETWAPTIAAHL